MPRHNADPNEIRIQKCPWCGDYIDLDTGLCRNMDCNYDAEKEDEKARRKDDKVELTISNRGLYVFYTDKAAHC